MIADPLGGPIEWSNLTAAWSTACQCGFVSLSMAHDNGCVAVQITGQVANLQIRRPC